VTTSVATGKPRRAGQRRGDVIFAGSTRLAGLLILLALAGGAPGGSMYGQPDLPSPTTAIGAAY
jgi:hypothetical protein